MVSENPGKPHIRSLEAVRSLQIVVSELRAWSNSHLTATTGAVTPFIRVVRNRVGIIDAFQNDNAGTTTFTSAHQEITEALNDGAGLLRRSLQLLATAILFSAQGIGTAWTILPGVPELVERHFA